MITSNMTRSQGTSMSCQSRDERESVRVWINEGITTKSHPLLQSSVTGGYNVNWGVYARIARAIIYLYNTHLCRLLPTPWFHLKSTPTDLGLCSSPRLDCYPSLGSTTQLANPSLKFKVRLGCLGSPSPLSLQRNICCCFQHQSTSGDKYSICGKVIWIKVAFKKSAIGVVQSSLTCRAGEL